MNNKKRPVKKANHERWLVSYADFMTLLFCFFVVMYSISSVNETKYHTLSDVLDSAFKLQKKVLKPIQLDKPVTPADQHPVDWPISEMDNMRDQTLGRFENIYAELESTFKSLIDEDLVKLVHNQDWVEVEVNGKFLFETASSLPTPEAEKLVATLATTLRKIKFPMIVEGYTDNIPIQNDQYPSNWELSAARAAAIVRLLVQNGLPPINLSATGFAENFAHYSNATAEGRGKNRRVVIVIEKQDARRQSLAERAYRETP